MATDSDLLETRIATGRGSMEFRVARFLFRSNRSALIWLVVRLWVAWEWLDAGWEKAAGSGAANWFTHPDQLKAFIGGANYAWENQALTQGHPQVPYKWVLNVVNDMSGNALFFSRVVTIAELAIGAGLLFGCLTGVAAAGGVALNFMYIASGSAGTNGILMALGILLILAWRVAGHYGIDRFILTPQGRSRLTAMLHRGQSAPSANRSESPAGPPPSGVPTEPVVDRPLQPVMNHESVA